MIDELTPVAIYIAHEMNTNARSVDCRRMAELNASSSAACIAEYFKAPWWRKLFGTIPPQQCMDIEISGHQAALMMWAMKVRQDGEWDHKPQIRVRFISPTSHTGVWHTYDKTQYYYDIWSNIHFGYVGTAAGFDEDTLLDGAGLEQIGTDLLRRRWPKRSLGVQGLRSFDDPSDRIAISMGVKLYGLIPDHISDFQLVESILTTADLDTRPVPVK